MFLPDTFYAGMYMIGKMDIPNFFLPFLPLTSDLKRLKAYTYIDPYFVFSDRDTNIIQYLDALRTKESLSKDAPFSGFDAYFPNKANFLYYKKLESHDSSSPHFSHLQSKVKAYRLQINQYKKNTMFFTLVMDVNP